MQIFKLSQKSTFSWNFLLKIIHIENTCVFMKILKIKFFKWGLLRPGPSFQIKICLIPLWRIKPCKQWLVTEDKVLIQRTKLRVSQTCSFTSVCLGPDPVIWGREGNLQDARDKTWITCMLGKSLFLHSLDPGLFLGTLNGFSKIKAFFIVQIPNASCLKKHSFGSCVSLCSKGKHRLLQFST